MASEDQVIHPSSTLLKTAYVVGFITLICVAAAKSFGALDSFGEYWWVCFAPPLIYLTWTAVRHAGLMITKLVINEDRIRLETGLLSKQMHAIDVTKIHDVRVEQSVKQRVIGVGNLTVETASGSSKIFIADIDRPQQVADQILQLSRKALQNRPSTAAGA